MTVSRNLRDHRALVPAAPLTPAERRVLDLVRRHPGLSRAEIAATLNLSPSLLTKAVGHFQAMALVGEEREEAHRRGQPARRLTIREGAVAGIGVSLQKRGLWAASLDLCGAVRDTRWVRANTQDTAAGLEAAVPVIHALGARANRCAGVGLQVPAIQRRDGTIVEVTPAMRGIDFAAYRAGLEDALGLPVWLEGQARAVYEAMEQTDRDAVLYVLLLDYGIGGSVIDGQRLVRGGFGQASNIGALVPETGMRPSLPDLARFLDLPTENLQLEDIEARFKAGDRQLRAWIESRGAALSRPLSTVVQLINPTEIVVGGLFPRSVVEGLIAYVDLSLYDHPGRAPLTKPIIRPADQVGAASLAITAAAVPLLHQFVPDAG